LSISRIFKEHEEGGMNARKNINSVSGTDKDIQSISPIPGFRRNTFDGIIPKD
jgi:hypothetical protein